MIERIIGNESGGNPHAINLTDNNAKAGTPSKGILQYIDPTFNNYAMPGHHGNGL
ncbi:transglycosylase SLT domain-containing protein [Companilactobacillus alimentarius]|uniref:transglycosylase SLT domain-containing protein n=1 Tax=Companilactobacillus alimentarius TaxID=1602 RepID=UPI0028B7DCEC|nr:transglycosylase SLT domain-containing protein [Companilactobacillus alimentarius]MDT6953707.1 transglycosylase SLT domain-containing protein [Companilactobacillus alimentarius]